MPLHWNLTFFAFAKTRPTGFASSIGLCTCKKNISHSQKLGKLSIQKHVWQDITLLSECQVFKVTLPMDLVFSFISMWGDFSLQQNQKVYTGGKTLQYRLSLFLFSLVSGECFTVRNLTQTRTMWKSFHSMTGMSNSFWYRDHIQPDKMSNGEDRYITNIITYT